MRRSLWMLAIAVGFIVAWSIGRIQAQGDKVIFADPNHASFTEMPDAGRAGVSSATLWGTQVPARLALTRNSCPDGMLAGTRILPMYGSSALKAPICTRTNPARSA